MAKALDGFRREGLPRCFLEVTAQNESAIRLYQRLGFVTSRTVYKAVEI
jgi:ribosomal protein S18 acetylase RimI-like enzyme